MNICILSALISVNSHGSKGTPDTEHVSRLTAFCNSFISIIHSFLILASSNLSSSFFFSVSIVSKLRTYSITRFFESLIPRTGIPEKISPHPCFCSINIHEKINCIYNLRCFPSVAGTSGNSRCRNLSKNV